MGLDGLVDLPVAMALLVGRAVGVQLGTWICQKLRARPLRRYFAALVILVAAILAGRLARSLLE